MGTELGHGLGGIDGLACLQLADALTKRLMQPPSFLVIEVITTGRQHFIDGYKLEHFTLGQVGGFVEEDAAVVDVGSKWLHRSQV